MRGREREKERGRGKGGKEGERKRERERGREEGGREERRTITNAIDLTDHQYSARRHPKLHPPQEQGPLTPHRAPWLHR